jgi:3-methylcrotonyl-CoA carboxylase alpha subunit/acetyl-CoA/propionyl-CoA carboxylase biotin carboxyl carrier protein
MGFDTLLVANRGAVARRVLRTARRLGFRTVAVYSDADCDAPHVAEADRAVRIGPAAAADSYLSISAILEAARSAGAGGVHPGYGFLAESAAFARACETAGLVFVGPQPEVIELMSRKDRARRLATEAGAPVVPAVEGEDSGALAARVGPEIGYPALVKAVAGGGGRGMRLVTRPADLVPALEAAGREALAAFGDPALFVERYLPEGRHLEVQVVGDGTGRVLHLGDRDCSVQRRHQKVVEEAPATPCSPAARARALQAATAIAARVRYRSLGTVEFLAAGASVHFLEMNTRLQVEHGVTEAVTGVDLVELQLRLAAGEPLGLAQDEIAIRGHAIEARVCAEDAEHGFLPQTGRATLVRWPAEGRVDATLEAGLAVTTDYDSMLATLIAHGETRQVARSRLIDALDSTAVFGLTTNTGFLRRLLASEPFARAEITPAWLDGHAAELGAADPWPALAAAGAILAETARRRDTGDPWGADGWRSAGPPAPAAVELTLDGELRRILVRGGAAGADGDLEVEGPGRSARVRVVRLDADTLVAELDGEREHFVFVAAAGVLLIAHRGEVFRLTTGFGPAPATAGRGEVVMAPLPGVLVSVSVAAGDRVDAGAVLGILESMKMEYTLTADVAARVERVGFAAGGQVARGDILFELVPEGSS